MSEVTYVCPVCGYDGLWGPPADYLICPSCGTEFENDDFEFTHEELRQRWVATGPRWWSPNNPPPPGWDPWKQLARVV